MTVEPLGDGVRVALGGDLDMISAYTFDARLRDVESRAPEHILLDIRELNFVDSAGLGRILAAHRRGRTCGRSVRLPRGTKTVQRVLAIAAIDQVLEFAPEPVAA
jgi:anti-anti-sigma factor